MGGYAEVALPLSVERTFIYTIPEALTHKIVPGCAVLVPFRNRKLTGWVVGLREEVELRSGVKEILELTSPQPLFSDTMLKFTKWVSGYYLCSWGEVLKAALPKGLEKKERRTVTLKSPITSETLNHTSPTGRKILRLLDQSGELSLAKLKKSLGGRGIGVALRSLEREDLVELKSTIEKPKTKAKMEYVFSLKGELSEEEIEAITKRSPKQADVLDYLLKHGMTARGELRKALGVSSRTLKSLQRRGLVQLSVKEVFRSPLEELVVEETEEVLLSGEQTKVFSKIERSLRKGVFESFLLHGITGSGKTEIYLRSIRETLSLGRRTILLVPEISLTPQILSTLVSRFGGAVGVLHSHLSPGERYDIWRKAKAGEYPIVVGARSAVFAPLENLGLIIVDEEHETSYKQDEPDPKYSARDVAIVRAKMEGAVCLLGSATPSLESFYNTQKGKSILTRLPRRVKGRRLPQVTVVDMKGSGSQVFSPPLLEKIEDRLRKGEQTILFLNRRGFSNFLFCQDCGFVFKCGNCSVSLTHHREEGVLLCHYCGARAALPNECPNCRGTRVTSRGIGTQRVERELKSLFPALRVVRMDVDTTSRKRSHQEIFYSFKRGETDLLLGTQMVAKGFDIPKVTLVGVISADTALNLPDFRSGERTFQLLTQVAGRTGRGELGGEVIIQTYSPDHYAIQFARNQDYLGFYQREIEERRSLGYPPFSRLGRIVFSSPDDEETRTEAERVISALKKSGGSRMETLGPAPAPLSKVKSNYRWQILLKGKEQPSIQRAIRRALGGPRSEKVRITVTIDPVDMM